jgi:uncharacterized protein YoxC
MPEHESPSPVTAAGVGDPVVSPTHASKPLVDRLQAVERTVAEMASYLKDQLPERLARDSESGRSHLAALARELGAAFRTLLDDIRGLRTSMGEVVSGAEDRLSRAVTGAEGRLADAVTRVSESLGRRLEESAESMGTQAEGMRDLLDRDRVALRERLDGSSAAIQGRLDETVAALRALLDDVAAGIKADLEAFRGLPVQLGEGVAAVRDSVADIAAAHAAIEERLSEVAAATSGEAVRNRIDETAEVLGEKLGEAAGSMRWEVQESLKGVRDQLSALAENLTTVQAETNERGTALQEGLARVDRLAEAVESIGHRRGFKQVVESDQRIRDEQAAMVDRLAEAGQLLSSHMEEVRAELGELQRTARDSQAGVLADEIRRRVVDELGTEQLVEAMVERVQATFEARLAEVLERVESRLDASTPSEPERRRRFRRREQA